MERFGGGPTRGRTPPGVDEAERGGTTTDSLVSELLFETEAFSTVCRYRDLTIVPPDLVFLVVPLLLALVFSLPTLELK